MKRHNKFKKFLVQQITTTLSLGLLLASAPARAQSLVGQWKQGLSGSQLINHVGSKAYSRNSHSSLTVINFCPNGRYSYYQEGGWSIPGAARGASNNRITGRWDIQQKGYQILLVYATDKGKKGAFPIHLQNNGRVNIGGTSFAAQRGGAKC